MHSQGGGDLEREKGATDMQSLIINRMRKERCKLAFGQNKKLLA